MRPDAAALMDYYRSRNGQRMLGMLRPLVMQTLRRGSRQRILGLGYALPYLIGTDAQIVQACPALQGAARWPQTGANRCCLVEERQLPFVDALFDQVVLVHALEYADPARRLLREIWRVLAPAGEIIVIVPNRSALMVLGDHSPFGNGRPFSASQLRQLLEDALFMPRSTRTCAALPGRLADTLLDRLLIRVMPGLGGLHVVQAGKCDGAAPVRGVPEHSLRWAEAP